MKKRAFELLVTPDTRGRGAKLLNAMRASAIGYGIEANITNQYAGNCETLVMWGAGELRRSNYMQQHLKKGGHVIIWDMGYWHAKHAVAENSLNRISIDHMHPQKFVMQFNFDRSRFESYGIEVKNFYDPNGHIILVGMGDKSCASFGIRHGQWEMETLSKILASESLRGKKVIYRPKPNTKHHITWHKTDGVSPISELLRGCSLVVCRHSNVAVDAIIHGVPVACEDGAASAVYDNQIIAKNPISQELANSFLSNISHYHYTISEVLEGAAWKFLKTLQIAK
jgi:hypothetical protein